MNWKPKKVFYSLGAVVLIFFIMKVANGVLMPVAFSIMITIILFPICKWLEKKGMSRLWSTIVTLFSVIIFCLGIVVLFSTQIVNVLSDLEGFQSKLTGIFSQLITFLNENLPVSINIERQELLQKGKEFFFKSGGPFISDTIGVTGTMLSHMVLIVIYVFLILFYRKGLFSALVDMVKDREKNDYANMLKDIQKVGKEYIFGMMIIILILGGLYSISFWIWGLDYPVLFGFLAAALAIIPYIGTTIGATIPILYAFFTFDSVLYPLGIMANIWVIQFIEGNFLTPKIVGGSMHINALAAIFALIFGNFIWGISGMILFLPFMAMLRIICMNYEGLKPIGKLISEDVR